MKRLTAEKVYYFFDPGIEPAIIIKPGETIVVETLDAASGVLRTEKDLLTPKELDRRGIPGVNPVTGPIYVEGTEPGDNLVVDIKEIKCGGALHQGFTVLTPGQGGLSGPYSVLPAFRHRTKICRIKDGMVMFPVKNKKAIEIPLNPIIGTIGVAPKAERISTAFHGQEFCGNIDSPDATVDNKIVLRANVEGGLLSMGDIAAASGDGELCASHIDTEGEVTIAVDLIKEENTQYIAWPQIEYPDRIGSIGCPFSGSLDDAYRSAYYDLTLRLEIFFGFELLDAYQLLSSVGEIRVNQGIDPYWYSCVARVLKKYIT